MEAILTIKGNVAFPITLDPGVWIFDDRKVDLDTFFSTGAGNGQDDLEEYTKRASKHWDREIMEGAIHPPTLKTEKKYEKEKLLNGTFGMPLTPFIKNAQPKKEASTLIIECRTGNVRLPLSDSDNLLAGFSQAGKPIKEGGPVYIYFKDGSNSANPLRDVTGFIIE
ncbi:peptidyl-prolyl cis-trans isomerase [Peribacillus sp. SCS-26]|uniref:peptidyl-prolyl cis-trans isomerase n=1 Tax=Paraperibacillus marinus TaxID=3115295 RepID=UPI003906245E